MNNRKEIIHTVNDQEADSSTPPWVTERRRRRQRMESQRREAERHLQQGDPRLALAAFLRLSEEGIESLPMLNRASEHLLARRLEEGMVLLLHLAGTYHREGFHTKSAALYKKALRHAPDRAEIRYELANLYRQRGLEAEARALSRFGGESRVTAQHGTVGRNPRNDGP